LSRIQRIYELRTNSRSFSRERRVARRAFRFVERSAQPELPAMRARFAISVGRGEIRSRIAEQFAEADFETVASPAIGGLIIGYAVAQALNRPLHLDGTRKRAR
jgi:adenine/guanine phosphoribosyltransferase-like PRPP-binding protein